MELPLISVIGPVEPDLITAFVTHYQALGVTRFLVAFHTTPGTDPQRARAALQRYEDLAGPATQISHGPWHEDIQTRLRDELRTKAGSGWAIYADVDELQAWPVPPTQWLHTDAADAGTIGGLMLDRIAADGSLCTWDSARGLDGTYPLGGFLTHLLLHGDPRKIVAARADVPLAAGCHRAPGHRPRNHPPVVVHHFKWRDGVLPYLRQRADLMGHQWHENSPAIRTEAARLLDHVADHDGRIDVHNPYVPLRLVTLTHQPLWWPSEACRIIDTWQPPQPTGSHR